jgi:hypothetical protein
MSKKLNVLRISSLVFWIILALILLLPFFEGIFFSVETTEDWLKSFDEEQFIDEDSINHMKEDIEKLPKYDINWVWSDYDGFNHQISFKVLKRDVNRAINYRKSYSVFFSKSKIYSDFIRATIVNSFANIVTLNRAKKANMQGIYLHENIKCEQILTKKCQKTQTKTTIVLVEKNTNTCQAYAITKGFVLE